MQNSACSRMALRLVLPIGVAIWLMTLPSGLGNRIEVVEDLLADGSKFEAGRWTEQTVANEVTAAIHAHRHQRLALRNFTDVDAKLEVASVQAAVATQDGLGTQLAASATSVSKVKPLLRPKASPIVMAAIFAMNQLGYPWLASKAGLASKAFSMLSMLKGVQGTDYVAIIQMDMATFPGVPEEPESYLTVTTSFNEDLKNEKSYDTAEMENIIMPRNLAGEIWGSAQVQQYDGRKDGPAGRVIAVNGNSAMGRNGVKLPYGSAKLINVKGTTTVRVFTHVRAVAHYGMGNDMIGAPEMTEVLEEVDEVCKTSRLLAGGATYVYTGPSARSKCEFKDITGYSIDSLTSELCGGEAHRENWEACMLHLICAIDELVWADLPGSLVRSVSNVRAMNSRACPDVGVERPEARKGFFHQTATCNPKDEGCSNGQCYYCGTEGLCCQHPGFVSPLVFSTNLTENGCESKGCHYRHCCVHK